MAAILEKDHAAVKCCIVVHVQQRHVYLLVSNPGSGFMHSHMGLQIVAGQGSLEVLQVHPAGLKGMHMDAGALCRVGRQIAANLSTCA